MNIGKLFAGRRGQGAFEYILLLAGVLLVVVLAIIILRGSVLTGAEKNIEEGQTAASAASCGTPYADANNQVLNGWNGAVCCSQGFDKLTDACCAKGLQEGSYSNENDPNFKGKAAGTCRT